MTRATLEASDIRQKLASRQASLTLLLLVIFSFLYFADVFLRASGKYFWYDEFFTIYVCRIPSLRGILAALAHGVDFNPPLFYVITRVSQALFGRGLIGTRLPEILGFWVLSICLFRFVSRRAGPIAGFVAMALPMFTGAFYYAYEARPHGLVLGFCGLAIVCWQASSEQAYRRLWLFGFGVSLLAAFMCHCYALVIAVPFGLAELIRGFREKRLNWPVWIAIIAPALIAGLSFVPLLQSYKAVNEGTKFPQAFPAVWEQVPRFYDFLLSPCAWILLVAFVLLALDRERFLPALKSMQREKVSLLSDEMILAIGFTALPIFGLLLGVAIHGPYIMRYFISSVAGISILVGFSMGVRKTADSFQLAFAAVIGVTLAASTIMLLYHWRQGWGEKLVEPSSVINLNTTPGDPLDAYSLLIRGSRNSLPILMLSPIDFLYLVHYAPQLAPRLYYVGQPSTDVFYRGFQLLRTWCPVDRYNRELTPEEFSRAHPDYLVYGIKGIGRVQDVITPGTQVTSFASSNTEILIGMNANGTH